jgi:hypothetical protein
MIHADFGNNEWGVHAMSTAGIPYAFESCFKDLFTKLNAPIVTFAPISTPGATPTPRPRNVLLPTETFPQRVTRGLRITDSPSLLPCSTTECVLIIEKFPIEQKGPMYEYAKTRVPAPMSEL